MANPILKLPKVIGHRGACEYAPENTLASIYKAYELGTQWIEFDVMLTSDEIAIVMHDETLERTTNGKGEVANTSYAAIARLDAGSWFAKNFANEKVPTFVEVLNYANKLNLGINVEIKPTLAKDKITAQKVMELLAKHWPYSQDRLLVSSFSVDSLHVARNFDANINLGLLVHEWFDGWQNLLVELDCISFNVNHEILTPNVVKHVKNSGRYVLTYTVNDSARAQQLFSWGVDAVFSNVPDKIMCLMHIDDKNN